MLFRSEQGIPVAFMNGFGMPASSPLLRTLGLKPVKGRLAGPVQIVSQDKMMGFEQPVAPDASEAVAVQVEDGAAGTRSLLRLRAGTVTYDSLRIDQRGLQCQAGFDYLQLPQHRCTEKIDPRTAFKQVSHNVSTSHMGCAAQSRFKVATAPVDRTIQQPRFTFKQLLHQLQFRVSKDDEILQHLPIQLLLFPRRLELRRVIIAFEFRYYVNNFDIDLDSLEVAVLESTSQSDASKVTYSLISDITTLTPESLIYYLFETTDRRYEISFGDGVLGKKLTSGNVVIISYQTSSGDLSNGPSDFQLATQIDGRFGNSSIVYYNVVDSYGGDQEENLDSIRLSALQNFRTDRKSTRLNSSH